MFKRASDVTQVVKLAASFAVFTDEVAVDDLLLVTMKSTPWFYLCLRSLDTDCGEGRVEGRPRPN